MRYDYIKRVYGASFYPDDKVQALVEALRLADGFLKNKGYSEHDPLVRGAILSALAPFTDGGTQG